MKNSIKLTIAVATTMAFVGTALALMPSDRDNQYILLGKMEGEQIQLSKTNDQLRAQIDANSKQWQVIENERITLHDSLFQ